MKLSCTLRQWILLGGPSAGVDGTRLSRSITAHPSQDLLERESTRPGTQANLNYAYRERVAQGKACRKRALHRQAGPGQGPGVKKMNLRGVGVSLTFLSE